MNAFYIYRGGIEMLYWRGEWHIGMDSIPDHLDINTICFCLECKHDLTFRWHFMRRWQVASCPACKTPGVLWYWICQDGHTKAIKLLMGACKLFDIADENQRKEQARRLGGSKRPKDRFVKECSGEPSSSSVAERSPDDDYPGQGSGRFDDSDD